MLSQKHNQTSLNIIKVTADTVKELAKLLGEYQEFYKAEANDSHNLQFLENFLNSDDGVFFIAQKGEQSIGYVNFYFSYSSVSARKIAILNDLYVQNQFRGQGIGKALIDFALNYATELGIGQIRWATRLDNAQAQKLYAKYPAIKTDWFHYDLKV